jgi:hypothetical protein
MLFIKKIHIIVVYFLFYYSIIDFLKMLVDNI